MRAAGWVLMALVLTPSTFAQAPVKSIEDGALDRIQLFAATLEDPSRLTVVMRSFDTSTADLGTGAKDGKDARQQEG